MGGVLGRPLVAARARKRDAISFVWVMQTTACRLECGATLRGRQRSGSIGMSLVFGACECGHVFPSVWVFFGPFRQRGRSCAQLPTYVAAIPPDVQNAVLKTKITFRTS